MRRPSLLVLDDGALAPVLRVHTRPLDWQVTHVAPAEGPAAVLRDAPDIVVILDTPPASLAATVAAVRAVLPLRLGAIVTMTDDPTPRAGIDASLPVAASMLALVEAVQAQLRRQRPELMTSVLRVGDLVSDLDRYLVTRGSRRVAIEGRPFQLLRVLMAHPDRLLTRAELVWRLSRRGGAIDATSVNVYMRRLRGALVQGDEPDPIVTVRGIGYLLSVPDAAHAHDERRANAG